MFSVRPHTNVGAVFFLGLMLAGALMLAAGLLDTSPVRTGVTLPERAASYVTSSSMAAFRICWRAPMWRTPTPATPW